MPREERAAACLDDEHQAAIALRASRLTTPYKGMIEAVMPRSPQRFGAQVQRLAASAACA
jgi:hypothetical protein